MTTPNTLTITIAKQKVDVEAEYRALIAGIQQVYGGVASYLLLGTTFTKAELVAKLQSRIDAAEATKSARSALRSTVAAEKALDNAVKPLRAAMKTFIQTREGKDSPVLQQFGFPETKTGKATPAVRAEAAKKAAATRQARGTKGRKQKAAIHGAVTGASTPVATGGAAAASPAPAPSAAAPAAGTIGPNPVPAATAKPQGGT